MQFQVGRQIPGASYSDIFPESSSIPGTFLLDARYCNFKLCSGVFCISLILIFDLTCSYLGTMRPFWDLLMSFFSTWLQSSLYSRAHWQYLSETSLCCVLCQEVLAHSCWEHELFPVLSVLVIVPPVLFSGSFPGLGSILTHMCCSVLSWRLQITVALFLCKVFAFQYSALQILATSLSRILNSVSSTLV